MKLNDKNPFRIRGNQWKTYGAHKEPMTGTIDFDNFLRAQTVVLDDVSMELLPVS